MFEEFEALNSAHRNANHLSNKLEASLFSVVEAVSTVSIALMLWEGGQLHARALVELGTVVAFIQYIQQFFVPIRDFSAKYAVMQSSMTPRSASSRSSTSRRSRFLHGRGRRRGCGARSSSTGCGSPTAARTGAARHLFRVAPGEQVAIVGATGSGRRPS